MENLDSAILVFFDDDLFIQWITDPDEFTDAYWNDWMKKNPGRISDLLSAKKIAADLKLAQQSTTSENLAKTIWENINRYTGQHDIAVNIADRPHSKRKFAVAASVAAILLLSVSIYYFSAPAKKPLQNSPEKVISSIVSNDLQQVNNTSESRIVYLVDGTKITLQPGASIKHAVFLKKDKREVYLDGDAFFEVAKDPNRPFYVYAHDIILRVLGTSFNVTTNNGNVTVLVKTGKVSVYKKSNRDKAEFILTPNESIRYTAQTQNIARSESDAGLSKAEMASRYIINFNFEETPVIKIFEVLEEAYGIKINYDEKVFSKCIITTALNDATFDEKLKIICEAVNAGYSIKNNEVDIEGNGCK